MEQKACGQNDERQLDDDRGGTTIKWVVGKAIKRLETERGASLYGRKNKKSLRRKKKNYCRPVWGGREEREERRE